MGSIVSVLRNAWEKQWPEVRAAVAGSLPQFIFARHPRDLGSSVPVFGYHVVDPKEFEADLNLLSRNGYVTISADALLDHLELRGLAPKPASLRCLRVLFLVPGPSFFRWNYFEPGHLK